MKKREEEKGKKRNEERLREGRRGKEKERMKKREEEKGEKKK